MPGIAAAGFRQVVHGGDGHAQAGGVWRVPDRKAGLSVASFSRVIVGRGNSSCSKSHPKRGALLLQLSQKPAAVDARQQATTTAGSCCS